MEAEKTVKSKPILGSIRWTFKKNSKFLPKWWEITILKIYRFKNNTGTQVIRSNANRALRLMFLQGHGSGVRKLGPQILGLDHEDWLRNFDQFFFYFSDFYEFKPVTLVLIGKTELWLKQEIVCINNHGLLSQLIKINVRSNCDLSFETLIHL